MDYSTLKVKISNDIASNKRLQEEVKILRSKINDKTAVYEDVVKFSKELGEVTSKSLVKYGIPNEEFGVWAEDLVAPMFRQMQSQSLAMSEAVQKVLNETNGIGIKPANVKPNESRIKHIVTRFKEAENVDEVSFLVGPDVASNIARSAVTDTLRANAKLINESGLKSYVIRSGNGCCAWCDSMTGIYAIGDEPDDFWRVHKDCTCSFEYKCDKTHSRISFITDKGFMIKDTTDL